LRLRDKSIPASIAVSSASNDSPAIEIVGFPPSPSTEGQKGVSLSAASDAAHNRHKPQMCGKGFFAAVDYFMIVH
jgi:hypothetical protein